MNETTILDAFIKQVQSRPQATAISFRHQSMNYEALEQRANRIARWISRRMKQQLDGVNEPLIPFCLEQGSDTIAVLIAILKLGGVYVPIDPDYPPSRIRHMVEDINARFIITQQSLSSDIAEALRDSGLALEYLQIDKASRDIAQESESPVQPIGTTPNSLCYVMYTSGSTGKPKGVAICHRGVTRLVLDTNYIEIRPDDCFAQVANITFDAATLEIWGALLNGARVALFTKDTVLNPQRLRAAIVESNVTAMFLTTTLFNQYVASDPTIFSSLRYLLFGGEAASVDAVRRLLSSGQAPQHLINGYGPTENTTFSTFFLIESPPSDPGSVVPIGKALSNSKCYVVDEHLRHVAPGESGELLVGGAGLARGYLNNEISTREKFIRNPVEGDGSIVYRTGDIVRELPSGDLVFVGRVDNQVKIRGFRIELEEIELVLDEHPDCAGAVVSVYENVSNTKSLRAHIRLKDYDNLPSVAELRAFIEKRLPSYMVPASFVVVDEFPLSTTGKIDRRAVAKLPYRALAMKKKFAAPRDALETDLQTLWAENIGSTKRQIGIRDNFFELGGNSLTAAQITASLREKLGVDISSADIFAAPTIEGLAARIHTCAPVVNDKFSSESKYSGLPLTWPQELIWLHQQFAPDVPFYNEPLTISIPEKLDTVIFEQALNTLIERHEALRLRLQYINGQPRQSIVPHEQIRLAMRDLRHLPMERAHKEALRVATEQARQHFNLAHDHLFRYELIRLEESRFCLYITGHHLVIDGVSMFQVFLPELEQSYRQLLRGTEVDLPQLPFKYRDYVSWQHGQATPSSWQKEVDYWKDKLAGMQRLNLSCDRPATATMTFRGKRQCLEFSRSLTQRIRDLASTEGTTLFITLLAAFKTLLFRYTGQEDIAVGTVVAGRNLAGLDGLVGAFNNTILLRSMVSAEISFLDVLSIVRQTCMEAYDNQTIPFQQVVRHITKVSGAIREMPVQVALVLEPNLKENPSGWEISQLDVHTDTAKFDLTFELDERADHIIGRVEYRTDLFDDDTIARMIRHYQILLDGITAAPHKPIGKLPLLDDAERHKLLVEWNDNKVNYDGPVCLHQLIESQVDRSLQATAFIHENRRMSYRELDANANRLARYLLQLDLEPQIPIVVWTERSIEHITIIFAILKAGAAYVPIGQDTVDRVRFILEDTGAPLVICDEAHRSRLDHLNSTIFVYDPTDPQLTSLPETRPHVYVAPEHLAYIIYTSGSTGRPKGVMIEHRQICNRVQWAAAYFRLDNSDVYLHMVSLAFDGALTPTWFSLNQGATVLIASELGMQDSDYLLRMISHYNVSCLCATPTILNFIADAHSRRQMAPLRHVISAGESLSVDLLERLRKVANRVFNGYGPTETTIQATSWEADAASTTRPPIGIAIANTPLYVLDDIMQLVPIGVPGELYIGGRGVGRGYLNRPELTERHFLPDPFASTEGATMYRTGDIVRYLPSGDIDYLGRRDNQVKVRGYRIELGEVEAAIRRFDEVKECTVQVRENEQGFKCIIAYLVAAPDHVISVTVFRTRLEEILPNYMLPSAMVVITELPLTLNGKIDSRALSEPPADQRPDTTDFVSPRSELEQQLHDIWALILGMEKISVHDNFFHLGGDSIMCLQIVDQAVRSGLSIGMRDILEYPTIAGLAKQIFLSVNAEQSGKDTFRLMTDEISEKEQKPLDGPVPLSPIQQWLFESLPADLNHWNQAFVLKANHWLDPSRLHHALRIISEHHDSLRLRFIKDDDGWHQHYATINDQGVEPILEVIDLSSIPPEDIQAQIAERANDYHCRINIENGPVVVAVVFETNKANKTNKNKGPQYAWIGIHHLVVDGVSWRILLDDLTTVYHQLAGGTTVQLPRKSWSFRRFVNALETYADGIVEHQLAFWKQQLSSNEPLRTDHNIGPGKVATQQKISRYLDTWLTSDLLRRACLETDIMSILLASLFETLAHWQERDEITVWLEGHGREAICNELDLSRTIGWFTSMYPVRLAADRRSEPLSILAAMQACMTRIPEHGVGYLALRYLSRNPAINAALTPVAVADVSFNYLGQMDAGQTSKDLFRLTDAPAGALLGNGNARCATLDINGFITGGRLRIDWSYNRDQFDTKTIETLATMLMQHLARLIDHCVARVQQSGQVSDTNQTEFTVSQLPLRNRRLIKLRAGRNDNTPFFCVHPAGGSAFCYRNLAERLTGPWPFYGLEAIDGYIGQSIAQMATDYIKAVKEVQPAGPYYLGGWSLGGIIAFEMARQLEAKGEKVEKLILIDSRPVDHKGQLAYMRHMTQDDAAILSLIGRHLAVISGRPFSTGYPELSRCSPDRRQAWFLEQLIEQEMFPESLVQGFVTKFIEDFREGLRLVFHHQDPGLINADIILFRASEISNHYAGFPALEEDVVPGGDASYGWSQYSRGQVEVRIVPGTHESLIFEPVVTLLARELSASLSERRFKYKLKFPRSIGSN